MQFKLKNQNVNKIDSEQKKYINEFTIFFFFLDKSYYQFK